MLKLFRRNTYFQLLLILIVAGMLWFPAFLHPLPLPTQQGGVLFYLLAEWITPRVGAFIALLLVLAEGFLLNSTLYKHKMISQNTLMPMLFYTIAMSIGPAQLTLTPIIVGNFFIILCVSQLLLSSTLLSPTFDKIFGASACIALATLFCPAMAAFLVPLVVNMITFSLYSLRDWAMLILGLAAPYIITETGYYLSDVMFYRNYLLVYDLTNLHIRIGGGMWQWISAVLFLLFLLAGITAILTSAQNRSMNLQKNNTAVIIFSLGGAAYLLYTTIIPLPTQCLAVPFAYGVTMLLYPPKRRELLPNLLLLVLWLGTLALNFLA